MQSINRRHGFGPYDQLQKAAEICAENLLRKPGSLTLVQTRHLHGAFCCLAKVLETRLVETAESDKEKKAIESQTIETMEKLKLRGCENQRWEHHVNKSGNHPWLIDQSKGAGRESNAGPHEPES